MKTKLVKLPLIAMSALIIVTQLSFKAAGEKKERKEENKEKVKAVRAFNNLEFDFDKAAIRRLDYQELDSLAELILTAGFAVKLRGHADSIGEYVYNWKLSKSRADQVKAYLISKGVQVSNIASTEYGDTKPIASNATAEGRQRNRRVEIELVQ